MADHPNGWSATHSSTQGVVRLPLVHFGVAKTTPNAHREWPKLPWETLGGGRGYPQASSGVGATSLDAYQGWSWPPTTSNMGGRPPTKFKVFSFFFFSFLV